MGCSDQHKSLQKYLQGLRKDGGLLGWLAVLGTMATWMTWTGMIKSLAVMMPRLQQQFTTSTWLFGWMIAIVDATVGFAGPFAPVLRKKFGTRAVFMVSGSCVGMSFIISSFLLNLPSIMVVLGLFAGPAVGICNILSRDLIGQCFTASHTTAMGIAGIGGSLAFVIFSPLTQLLSEHYGWRGTMLLLGAIFSHLAVCGALFKPPGRRIQSTKGRYWSVDKGINKVATGDDKKTKDRFCLTSECLSIRRSFSLELFSSLTYWLIVFISVVSMTMHVGWMIYFVSSVKIFKGYSLADASNFVIVFGVGKILGNVIVGPLVEKTRAFGMGPYTWMGISLLIPSVMYFVDPWLMSRWLIAINLFFFGIAHTFLFILNDVITKDVIGVDQLGIALGWIGLKGGIVRSLFLFFPGFLYDTLGSYTVAFMLMGCLNSLTVVALVTLAWIQRRRRRRDTTVLGNGTVA